MNQIAFKAQQKKIPNPKEIADSVTEGEKAEESHQKLLHNPIANVTFMNVVKVKFKMKWTT